MKCGTLAREKATYDSLVVWSCFYLDHCTSKAI